MKFITQTFAIIYIFLLSSVYIFSQNFKTPEFVKQEMVLKNFQAGGKSYSYKIVYPVGYKNENKLPVMLCLSSGLAYERIVDYNYYIFFRTDWIRPNFITILPFSDPGKSLKDFSETDIKNFIGYIKKNENVTENKWLISGSGFGGIAAFNFAKIYPGLFDGMILMPGKSELDSIPKEWSHYKILLAIGDNDDLDWKDFIELTTEQLKGKVDKLIRFRMYGQPHVLYPIYDIDTLYAKFFKDYWQNR